MNDLKRQAIYTYIHNSDESNEIVDLSDMDIAINTKGIIQEFITEDYDKFRVINRTSDEDFNAPLKDIIKDSDWLSTSRFGPEFNIGYKNLIKRYLPIDTNISYHHFDWILDKNLFVLLQHQATNYDFKVLKNFRSLVFNFTTQLRIQPSSKWLANYKLNKLLNLNKAYLEIIDKTIQGMNKHDEIFEQDPYIELTSNNYIDITLKSSYIFGKQITSNIELIYPEILIFPDAVFDDPIPEELEINNELIQNIIDIMHDYHNSIVSTNKRYLQPSDFIFKDKEKKFLTHVDNKLAVVNGLNLDALLYFYLHGDSIPAHIEKKLIEEEIELSIPNSNITIDYEDLQGYRTFYKPFRVKKNSIYIRGINIPNSDSLFNKSYMQQNQMTEQQFIDTFYKDKDLPTKTFREIGIDYLVNSLFNQMFLSKFPGNIRRLFNEYLLSGKHIEWNSFFDFVINIMSEINAVNRIEEKQGKKRKISYHINIVKHGKKCTLNDDCIILQKK